MRGQFSMRMLSLLTLILNCSSGALPFTCSWDPSASADLSVGNPGSFPAFWTYSSDDSNNNGEDDYS